MMRALVCMLALGGAAACETTSSPPPPVEPPPPITSGTFTYHGPGALTANSGQGVTDRTVYAPNIVFPIAQHTTYLNSQVYGVSGALGPAGAGWCDARNYEYPWRDNFCEARSGTNRTTLNCPSNAVHQGQDIRAGSSDICNETRGIINSDRASNRVVPIAAVEAGFISYVGTYTVHVRAGDRIYRYMHLNMQALEIEAGDDVSAGQVIGYMSNDFGGTATTVHLHLEFKHNIDGVGWTWVSPYMSLVRAYERAIGEQGIELSDDG